MSKLVLGPPAISSKSKPASCDEKAPDSSDKTSSMRRAGWPKGKKRKKMPKEPSDPQKPLTAYNWFIKENREKIRTENPNMGFIDISKKMAQDWRALTSEQRQHYTTCAEEDKERYAKELEVYKQTEAYRTFVRNQRRKETHNNKKGKESSTIDESAERDDGTEFDVPIFTEEFLDHNKAREAELRQLRKSNTDYELQNSILEKLIENTRTAMAKLEEETVQQRCHNQALQQHLDHMRVVLTDAFSSVPLPGDEDIPSMHTIDTYMTKLHSLLRAQSTTSPLYLQVRDVIQQVDLLG